MKAIRYCNRMKKKMVTEGNKDTTQIIDSFKKP